MATSPGQIIRRIAALFEMGRSDEAGQLATKCANDGGAILSDAYVALQAPVAPLTWEAFGSIASTAQQSDQISIQFPRPVQLLAIRPVIRPASFTPAPPLVAATLDDILISGVIDQERQLTAQQNPATSSAAGAQFVTASNLSLALPRLLGQDIRTPTPTVTFQFRWRQGANVFVDSSVSVAVFARYRDDIPPGSA
jgi:hypothetical protein